MRFWGPSIETSERQFRQEFDHRADVLTSALGRIEATPRSTEQPGIWTVTGTDAIEDRILEFIAAAEREVVYMTIEDLLTDELVGELAAASDRDVAVVLAGLSESAYADIETAIPTAERFDTLWNRTDEPAGRVLLVDDEKALPSVIQLPRGRARGDSSLGQRRKQRVRIRSPGGIRLATKRVYGLNGSVSETNIHTTFITEALFEMSITTSCTRPRGGVTSNRRHRDSQ